MGHRFFLILILAAILAGCATRPIQPVSSQDDAFLFGHLVIEGHYKPDHIVLHKHGETYSTSNMPPYPHLYPDGSFAFDNLEPGRYHLVRVMDGNTIYNLKDDFSKSTTFEVKPGALMHLGSMNVTNVDHNFSGSGSFELDRLSEPGESEILRRLMPHLDGTGWDERARQYLQRSEQP